MLCIALFPNWSRWTQECWGINTEQESVWRINTDQDELRMLRDQHWSRWTQSVWGINTLIKTNSECWGVNKMHCYYLTFEPLQLKQLERMIFSSDYTKFLTKSHSVVWQESLLCTIPVAPSGWLYWGLTCKPDHKRTSSHTHNTQI